MKLYGMIGHNPGTHRLAWLLSDLHQGQGH